MPDTRRTGDATFSRRVAPFAPLALGLVGYAGPMVATASYAPLPIPSGAPPSLEYAKVATCDPEPVDADECHSTFPTGCSDAERPQYDAYLNLLKNWIDFPSSGATKYIDADDLESLEQNTPKDLSTRNHGEYSDELRQLGEGKLRGVVGYLYYGFPTGAESSNCKQTGTDNVDFHIGIGFDEDLAKMARVALATSKEAYRALKKKLEKNAMVVEMTPHYRSSVEPEWTIDRLSKVIGQKVRVKGQLVFDNEHANAAQNCGYAHAHAGSNCWRLSAWELHPVTSFEVCREEPCSASSSNWVALGTGID